MKTTIFSGVNETISRLPSVISKDRKNVLQPLIDYIKEKTINNEVINLNFICTHNSRRSHLSQIWAQTIASYLKIANVNCYSGGTEVTAMHPNIVEVLLKNGFEIQNLSDEKNPIYSIKYAHNCVPIIGFSKKFDTNFNPSSEFCAILTCSQADNGCPIITGAEKRVPITFEDPKIYDGTLLEKDKYLERSLEIASEMLYIFSSIN